MRTSDRVHRDRSRSLRVSALAVLAALGTLTGSLVGSGVAPAAAATTAAAAVPTKWDPRIADLATEVERLRGLRFEHPVPVRVLDDAAFEKQFLKGQTPTRRDRREWDQTQDAFIAMGFQEARIPFEDAQQGGASNVAGFYDPKEAAIVVRGSALDEPSTRVTLAHELTHALQDQHFHLRALQKRASRADSMLTQALVEGDATEVEQRYYASLSDGDQAAAAAANDAEIEQATPLPPFLEALMYAPYLMGTEAVRTLRAVGGQTRLDAVMRRPPTRDLGLVDPTALVGTPDWRRVAAPTLDAGDTARGDPFPMDAVGLYLVLAERLGWSDALGIAERWGGDRAQTFTRAGRPCVRMDVAGRHGQADVTAMADGFRRWAAAGDTDTQVTERDGLVGVTLCEPVNGVGTTPVAPAQALVGLSLRNELFAELAGSGLTPDVAKCASDRLVRLPEVDAVVTSVQAINDPIPDPASAAMRAAIGAKIADISAACRRSV